MKNQCSLARSTVAMALSGLLVLAGCASQPSAPVVGRDGQPSATTPVASKDVYTVKKGDTLYSIAREHGMDHRELIAMNGIENPNNIAVGRVLKVKSQGTTVTPISSEVVVAKPITSEPVVEARPLGPTTTDNNVKREPKAGKEPYSDQALAQAQGQNQPTPPESANKTESKAEKAPDAAAKAPEEAWVWPATGKVLGNFSDNGNKGVDIAGKKGDPVIAAGDGKVILANNTLRGYGNMVIVKHSPKLISVYAHNSKILVKEEQIVSKGQKIAEMGSSDADQVKLHFEVRLEGKPVDPLKYLPVR